MRDRERFRSRIKKERRVPVLTIEKGDMTVLDTKDNLIESKDGITCGCEIRV